MPMPYGEHVKTQFQPVDPDALKPEEQILQRLNDIMNLPFVRGQMVRLHLSTEGRPAIHPEVALRMVLLGYLFNLPPNQLENKVALHAGYRWFCGLAPNELVPTRNILDMTWRASDKSGVFQETLTNIVTQCAAVGLVVG